MNTKKWDDPQLDAAQFAIDRFLNAKEPSAIKWLRYTKP
jgi:hypothetical protein